MSLRTHHLPCEAMNHLQDDLMTAEITIVHVFPQGQQGMDVPPRRLGTGEGDMVRRQSRRGGCRTPMYETMEGRSSAMSDPHYKCLVWRMEPDCSHLDALSTRHSPDPVPSHPSASIPTRCEGVGGDCMDSGIGGARDAKPTAEGFAARLQYDIVDNAPPLRITLCATAGFRASATEVMDPPSLS